MYKRQDHTFRENANWTGKAISEVYRQAGSGGVLLSSMGNPEDVYKRQVHGRPKPPEGLIENYLRRDEKRKQVTLHRTRVPGAKTARTRYRTLTSVSYTHLCRRKGHGSGQNRAAG